MKQIFSKIFLLLALATTGFATTACDENTINQVLNILNQLNQGEQLYFTGSSTVMHCVWNEKNNQYEYQPSTGVASFKSHGLNMSVSSLSGQAASPLVTSLLKASQYPTSTSQPLPIATEPSVILQAKWHTEFRLPSSRTVRLQPSTTLHPTQPSTHVL